MQTLPNFDAPTLQDLDASNMTNGGRVGGNSKRQFVRFYKRKLMKLVKNSAGHMESKEVEKEFVNIVTPGDTNIIDDEAREFHKREFWAHYKAFRDGRTAPIGMPIEETSFIGPELVSEMKYRGVHTVEQLAEAADYLVDQLPNGGDLREFARAQVRANDSDKTFSQVNALKLELEKARKQIEEHSKLLQPQIVATAPVTQSGPKMVEGISRGPTRPGASKE